MYLIIIVSVHKNLTILLQKCRILTGKIKFWWIKLTYHMILNQILSMTDQNEMLDQSHTL